MLGLTLQAALEKDLTATLHLLSFPVPLNRRRVQWSLASGYVFLRDWQPSMNLRRATPTREKDSKQTERIEGAHSVMIDVIPFMREERWLVARVSQGMHEMDKCEAVCFRARQNPCAVRSKDFLGSAGKLKGGTMRRKGLRKLRLCIQQ